MSMISHQGARTTVIVNDRLVTHDGAVQDVVVAYPESGS
jgi:hypothetical protein